MKVTQRKKFMVGLFMAGGTAMALVIFFWLGVSSFLEEGQRYITYFDQSVQGLAVDSPVKFRGVTIGRVGRIGVAPDGRLVEVVLVLEQDLEPPAGVFAQLTVVGITGVMYIELDLPRPGEDPKPPELNFEPPYPVIPSRPSSISQFFTEIERLLNRIATLDLEKLSSQLSRSMESFTQTMTALREAVEQLQMEEASAALQTAMQTLNQDLEKAGEILEQTGTTLDQAAPELQAGLADFRTAMGNLQTFTREAGSLTESTDDYLAGLNEQFLRISGNLQQAIDNLNRLLERLADQPSQLLFGEPPPSRLEER